MRILVKNILSIISSVLIFVVLSGNRVVALAQEPSIDLLVSEGESIEQLKEELTEVDNKLEFIEIPEINLLRIENPNEKVQEVIENSDEIDFSGKISDKLILENNTITEKNVDFPKIFQYSAEEQNIETELLNRLTWYINTLTQDKKAFEYSKGKNIKIGLIDSGVDTSHPLISPSLNLEKAKSFVKNDQSIEDSNGHGTMVAGVISQVSPEAKITPYRVMSAIDGESIWTLQAIIRAVNDKQDIINMSLGTYKYETKKDERITIEAFKRAACYAFIKKVLIISSSGNQQLDSDVNYRENKIMHLPGDIKGVITVSAINKNNQLTNYSNTGTNVQYTAPGGEIIIDENGYLDARELIYTMYPLTLPNPMKDAGIPDGYTLTYGTSFSSAGVTAVFANYYSYYLQIMQKKPNSQNAHKFIAYNSTDFGVVGKDSQYGYGLPNLIRAYELISSNKNH
ncbi:hypothetical protein CKN99_14700 [Carnobacterium maltaromaticum]|uniref:S8 family peptidase n=1 Tax=Carnobacterium maltaromaticum TaxID=2751 RepID=UPI00107212EB|nr:S8 family peptidase [Carnobacterium maltaromaticum]MDT1943653.1 S8 family peptidase [Carnobacterium maltaromaticum]MDT1999033.1 S8 family peptidase [Carnobacterium maltaromaticum]TFJ24536.1 hypothetical protein CKN90_14660 [Carnobacterium maltaromaticum]TFJ29941.1 hypothetical protein CKN98_14665 [Carnobacterium maltaromaticum]TFJ33079.1 hypothetical protein CKN88_14625 [Carnobacterium maltaromaticum]